MKTLDLHVQTRVTGKFVKVFLKKNKKDKGKCIACYTFNNGRMVEVGDGDRSMKIVSDPDREFLNSTSGLRIAKISFRNGKMSKNY